MAPIIITILIICYFIFYMWIGLYTADTPLLMKILLIVFPIGLIALSICMLFERIKEIEDGEEDDLSKY